MDNSQLSELVSPGPKYQNKNGYFYKKYKDTTLQSKLRSSEEFVKNQNCYLSLRKNSPQDRYAEIGANLGIQYQTAYEQMQQEAKELNHLSRFPELKSIRASLVESQVQALSKVNGGQTPLQPNQVTIQSIEQQVRSHGSETPAPLDGGNSEQIDMSGRQQMHATLDVSSIQHGVKLNRLSYMTPRQKMVQQVRATSLYQRPNLQQDEELLHMDTGRSSVISPTCQATMKTRILLQPYPPDHQHEFVSMIGKRPGEKKTYWKLGSSMRYSINGNKPYGGSSLMSPMGDHNPLSQSVNFGLKTPGDTQHMRQDSTIVLPSMMSPGDTIKKTNRHDDEFERLHKGKTFLRSDPAPVDTEKTANSRLINNKNNFKQFVHRESDQYKAKVFENFKDMSRQMNKAYLRLVENKKFFKAGNAAIPEDRQKLKEEDDRTLDQIGTIFKYIHSNQKVTSSIVNTGRFVGA